MLWKILSTSFLLVHPFTNFSHAHLTLLVAVKWRAELSATLHCRGGWVAEPPSRSVTAVCTCPANIYNFTTRVNIERHHLHLLYLSILLIPDEEKDSNEGLRLPWNEFRYTFVFRFECHPCFLFLLLSWVIYILIHASLANNWGAKY